MGLEVRFPCRQLLHLYSKTDVKGTRSIVGRNDPTRKICAFERSAANKEQQNVSGRNVKSAEARIFDEQREAEDLLVERFGSRQVIHVEAGFLQISQPWHQVV